MHKIRQAIILFLIAVPLLIVIMGCADKRDPELKKIDQRALIPKRVGGTFGYTNMQGEMVIEPQFGSASTFHHGAAVVGLLPKGICLINTKGEPLDFGKFRNAWYTPEQRHFVLQINDDNFRFVNEDLELYNPEFFILKKFGDNVFTAQKNDHNGLKGFVDESLNVLLPFELTQIDQRPGRYTGVNVPIRVLHSNGKYGFVDQKGNYVIKPTYEFAHNFCEQFDTIHPGEPYYIAKDKRKMSDINIVKIDDKWGCIKPDGTYVQEPVLASEEEAIIQLIEYEEGTSYYEGLVVDSKKIDRKSLYGYLDETGEIVIDYQFNRAKNFHESLAAVEVFVADTKTAWGYIDKTGEFVIPPAYEGAKDFSEGLAVVQLVLNRNYHRRKHGYINKRGEIVIDIQYDKAGQFSEGCAFVSNEDGFIGFIDRYGNHIFSMASNEEADAFHEGLVAYQVVYEEWGAKEPWGYKNKEGETVIEPQFKNATGFKDGKAKVLFFDNDFFWYYIDKEGNVLGRATWPLKGELDYLKAVEYPFRY